MKYIKTYENIDVPEIDDYIVVDDKYIAIVINTDPYEETIEVRFLDTNFQDIISLENITFITNYKSNAEIYLKSIIYNI